MYECLKFNLVICYLLLLLLPFSYDYLTRENERHRCYCTSVVEEDDYCFFYLLS